MVMQDNLFSECHPGLLFIYFAAVISLTILTIHPVVIGISFLGALSCRLMFQGKKRFLIDQLLVMMPVFCLVVLANAAFNHYGVTPIYYLKTGAVTLESIVYGAVLGAMLWTSVLWFSSVHLLFTTDKFVYLFGRVFPMFGLFMSIVFRFVPGFRERWRLIREGQACLGRDIRQQNFIGKFRCAAAEISILLTWALESGLMMVDSMRSRGYGMGKRTFYRNYPFYFWDKVIAVIAGVFFLGSLAGFSCGAGKSQYDPWIQLGGIPLDMQSMLTYLCWGIFCFYPVIVSAAGKCIYKKQEIRNGQKAF